MSPMSNFLLFHFLSPSLFPFSAFCITILSESFIYPPVLRSFLQPLSQRPASVTNSPSDKYIFQFTFCMCCLLFQQSSVIFLLLSFLISSWHHYSTTSQYSGPNIEELAISVTLKAYLFIVISFWFCNAALC